MSDENNDDNSFFTRPTVQFGVAAINALFTGISFSQDSKAAAAASAVAATCFTISALLKIKNQNNHENNTPQP